MGKKIHVYIKDDELVEWLDQKIEDGQFRNRSHGLEQGLKVLKSREPEPF